MVLRDGRRLSQVSVHGADLRDSDSFQIHDCAAGFEQLASLAGARGETWIGDFLILDNEVLKHTLSGGDLVQGIEIDFAKFFDVDRAAVLRNRLESAEEIQRLERCEWMRRRKFLQRGEANLVRLMVVLWIILEHLWLLRILEIPNQVLNSEVTPPSFDFNKPITHGRQHLAAILIIPGQTWSDDDRLPGNICLHLLAQFDIKFSSS